MRVADHSDPQIEGKYYVIDYVAYSGWLWWRRKHMSRAFVLSSELGNFMWRCANTGHQVHQRVDTRLDRITGTANKVREMKKCRAQALENFHNREIGVDAITSPLDNSSE